MLGETHLTYARVNAAADQVANLLVERGVQPGDRIALSSPNISWFPIVYYGALKVGAVVVPLNILLKAREVSYHLDDSDVTGYFCFEGTSDRPMGTEGHRGFLKSGAKHLFVITADPAAPSPISHANIAFNALTCNRLFSSEPATDTHVLALPLFHTFGATVQMHAGFSMAATLHLVPRFDAGQVIDLMQREAITFFAGVPTMWWGLLEALTDEVDVERIARNLRIGVSGGSKRDRGAHPNWAPLPRSFSPPSVAGQRATTRLLSLDPAHTCTSAPLVLHLITGGAGFDYNRSLAEGLGRSTGPCGEGNRTREEPLSALATGREHRAAGVGG